PQERSDYDCLCSELTPNSKLGDLCNYCLYSELGAPRLPSLDLSAIYCLYSDLIPYCKLGILQTY
ncbi:MAG: hypothetical protein ACE5KE_04625, partial [Methanosarcinales archaeon]